MEGLSKIATPLTSLTKKDIKLDWKGMHKRTFQELKEKLTLAPVLVIPKSGERFTIYSDALHQGLGCVLMQEDKVIDYGLRQLGV